MPIPAVLAEVCKEVGLKLTHQDGPTSIKCEGGCARCGVTALHLLAIIGETHVWIQETPNLWKWHLVDFTESGAEEKLREILIAKHK